MARKPYELRVQFYIEESQVERFVKAFSPYDMMASPSGPFYEFLRMWMCDSGEFYSETPSLVEVPQP